MPSSIAPALPLFGSLSPSFLPPSTDVTRTPGPPHAQSLDGPPLNFMPLFNEASTSLSLGWHLLAFLLLLCSRAWLSPVCLQWPFRMTPVFLRRPPSPPPHSVHVLDSVHTPAFNIHFCMDDPPLLEHPSDDPLWPSTGSSNLGCRNGLSCSPTPHPPSHLATKPTSVKVTDSL